MTHTTLSIHDDHGTTPWCMECHERLDDPVSETEADEIQRLHRGERRWVA